MPQRYRTDVLTPRQIEFIARYLPEPHAPRRPARLLQPAAPARYLEGPALGLPLA